MAEGRVAEHSHPCLETLARCVRTRSPADGIHDVCSSMLALAVPIAKGT